MYLYTYVYTRKSMCIYVPTGCICIPECAQMQCSRDGHIGDRKPVIRSYQRRAVLTCIQSTDCQEGKDDIFRQHCQNGLPERQGSGALFGAQWPPSFSRRFRPLTSLSGAQAFQSLRGVQPLLQLRVPHWSCSMNACRFMAQVAAPTTS